MPAGVIISPDVHFEPATAAWRRVSGKRGRWRWVGSPAKRGLSSGAWPGGHTHDDVFLGELARGHFTVTNARLGLAVSLDWDAEIFRYVVLWMPYGGSDAPPLTGMYGLGVEPWVARLQPGAAIAEGEARVLAPGESLETALRVTYTTTAN